MAEVLQSKHLKVLNYASVCECVNERVLSGRLTSLISLQLSIKPSKQPEMFQLCFPLTFTAAQSFLDDQLLSYECKV